MHGLNTRQDIALDPFVYAQNGNDVDQDAQIYFFSHSSTQNLRNLLFSSELDASTREYYVKRYYCTHYFTNTLPYPCIIEHSIVRARADIPRTTDQTNLGLAMNYALTNGLTDGLEWIESPYASIFSSPYFRKTFKILKSKQYVMKPGKMYRFKDSITPALAKRPIMNSKEGNTAQTIILKGGRVHIFRFYGVPFYTSSAGTAIPALGNFRVVHLTKFYASWYNMDDAADNQQITSLGNRVALTSGFPTMYQQAKPQTLFAYDPHILAGVNGGELNDDVSIMGMSTAVPLFVSP